MYIALDSRSGCSQSPWWWRYGWSGSEIWARICNLQWCDGRGGFSFVLSWNLCFMHWFIAPDIGMHLLSPGLTSPRFSLPQIWIKFYFRSGQNLCRIQWIENNDLWAIVRFSSDVNHFHHYPMSIWTCVHFSYLASWVFKFITKFVAFWSPSLCRYACTIPQQMPSVIYLTAKIVAAQVERERDYGWRIEVSNNKRNQSCHQNQVDRRNRLVFHIHVQLSNG